MSGTANARATGMSRMVCLVACLTGLACGAARDACAYSVLAHEATIDVAWEQSLRPLLLRRFPKSSPDDLVRARSFAYGGSVIQDLGYYPFGNKFFSNLLHYVRSGDFVATLIRDARDVDEYAFALGALAHYTDDCIAHPEATNKAVPRVFPKLARKFGPTVTYTQAPKEHIVVEFSFDVVQTAGGAYLPEAYRNFIGFRVAGALLQRAFRETYGLDMGQLFGDQERAISTYRYAISQLIPVLTKAAWQDKREEIAKLTPNMSQADFVFLYPTATYEREYGGEYQKPGLFARFIGFLYRIVPKIGPLRPLTFKPPTPDVEAMFADSFRDASRRYKAALAEVARNHIDLGNTDFDTGHPSRHGEYGLADDTYVELLDALEERSFDDVPTGLRKNILSFYGNTPAPSPAGKRDRKQWQLVQRALAALSEDPAGRRADTTAAPEHRGRF